MKSSEAKGYAITTDINYLLTTYKGEVKAWIYQSADSNMQKFAKSDGGLYSLAANGVCREITFEWMRQVNSNNPTLVKSLNEGPIPESLIKRYHDNNQSLKSVGSEATDHLEQGQEARLLGQEIAALLDQKDKLEAEQTVCKGKIAEWNQLYKKEGELDTETEIDPELLREQSALLQKSRDIRNEIKTLNVKINDLSKKHEEIAQTIAEHATKAQQDTTSLSTPFGKPAEKEICTNNNLGNASKHLSTLAPGCYSLMLKSTDSSGSHVIGINIADNGKCQFFDSNTGLFEFNKSSDLGQFFKNYMSLIDKKSKFDNFQILKWETPKPNLQQSAKSQQDNGKTSSWSSFTNMFKLS